MNGSDRPIWFVGDLDDPGAVAIASALPADSTGRIDAPGNLPTEWPVVEDDLPRVVVLHRAILGGTDGERVGRLRKQLGPARTIILCVGPHVRYFEVDRWLRWVDMVLTETVAAATIGRHVQRVNPPRPEPSRTVAVVSGNFELRATTAAILRSTGYEVVEHPELEEASKLPQLATVWDVPILEPNWRSRLSVRAATSPVLALIGFLDRGTANAALGAGAAAVLDLPYDLADLTQSVDRIVGVRRDQAHRNPPSPMRGSGKPIRES